MSGREAARQVLDMADREQVIDADVVARALTVSSRTLLRDWRRRNLPEQKIGRTILLPVRTVIETYRTVLVSGN